MQTNHDVEAGTAQPTQLVAACAPFLSRLHNRREHLSNLDSGRARKLIQSLGFVTGSIERHFQTQQCHPGVGLGFVPSVEDLLVSLSRAAFHPPRDTQHTYWVWNDETEPLTFTGDAQEAYFNRQVNAVNRLNLHAAEALRPICAMELLVTAPEALDCLRLAIDDTREICGRYRSFWAYDPVHDRRNVEPDFFMERMRTYLVSFPIDGVVWAGPNAANLRSQMWMDYSIGTVNASYPSVVDERLRYLPREEAEALKADVRRPSLMRVFLGQLQMTEDDLAAIPDVQLVQRVADRPRELHEALDVYGELVRVAGQAAGIHWWLIMEYLIKQATRSSHEKLATLAVKPTQGTGGATLDRTERIRDMRRKHDLINKLLRAVEAVVRGLRGRTERGEPPR
jgi:hypothetical protein